MNNKAYLRSITQTRQVQSGVTIASGNGTQIGDDIPANKTRHIWSVIASSDDGAEQNLAVYQGDSVDANRGTLLNARVPDTTNAPPLELGGDIESPILTVRPNTVDGLTPTTQGDVINLAHETSAVNVTISYYDLP